MRLLQTYSHAATGPSTSLPIHRYSPLVSALRPFAGEVRRIIRTANALILRKLWIRTQWPGHIDFVIGHVIRRKLIRRDSRLAPTFERTHEVHLIRPRSASAMLHTRSHEKPHPVVLFPAHF